ncbi:MAG: preprotein translocase subunit YajC [Actinomycetota bacterium]
MIDILAQSSSSSGGSPFTLIIFLLPLGLLFFLMRSQKRRSQQQQALQQSAEVGDEILTTAGIFGTIVDEDEDEGTVEVEIAPGTRIKMLRVGIARRVTEDDEADDGYADEPDEVQDHAEPDPHDDNAAGPISS